MNKKYLLIDSKYRDINDSLSTSTNFRYTLPQTVTMKEYIKLKLLYLPRVNYLITKNNCTFKIILTDTGTVINFFLPYGNYSPLELVTRINTQYSDNGFVTTYNTRSYEIAFLSSVAFKLDLTVGYFYRLLSLKPMIYDSSWAGNVFATFSSIINFNSPNYINLNINNITNTSIMGNKNNIQFGFIVPINSTNFGEIIKLDKEYVKIKISETKVNYLDIVLTDDYNEPFDNNNFDFYFVIEYLC